MLIFISVIFAGLLVLAGLILFWSFPGKPTPFVDESGKPLPGSISEKVFVDINGVKQGMFIKSKNAANPVLLYLHGGLPDYFLSRRYPTGLEDLFTVVWWEQRGAGLSFSPDIPRETMTLEQFIADTLEVTEYLRRRFGKDRIYLMGHSGGTFFGIQAAARNPELFYAYIGQAQMSNQLQSEKLAYDYMLAQYETRSDKKMVRKLKAAPVTMTGGAPKEYLAVRDRAMHPLGIGTMHEMHSILSGLFLPSLRNPDYTLMEKVRLWRGKVAAGVSTLWTTIMATDLSREITDIAVPVYFFHGRYDFTCSYPLAGEYFQKIHAPVKGFYTFENSAHSPMFEEPAKMAKILREDVLGGTNRLADAK